MSRARRRVPVPARHVRGQVALPDGHTYDIRALTMAERVTLSQLATRLTSDSVMGPHLLALVQRVTGAPTVVLGQLTLLELVSIATIASLGLADATSNIRRLQLEHGSLDNAVQALTPIIEAFHD